jgi:general secretion pathway protein I
MTGKRGFTFAELLAAMAFVAIVIPVAVQGLSIANRAGIVAQRKRVAMELADRKLTEVIVLDSIDEEDENGDFGDDWPGYTWALKDEAWQTDTMRVLSVEVFFKVQDYDYSVWLSTLVPEPEEEAEDEETQEAQL